MDKMATHKINVIANNHQKNLKLNNPALCYKKETLFIRNGIITISLLFIVMCFQLCILHLLNAQRRQFAI